MYKTTQRFREELLSCKCFNNTTVTWDKVLDTFIDKKKMWT